ncbi:MAG: YbaN family protein [Prevotellaceae bacterium]|jgi:uncharacterized membrane protein YbaN (DUF454 family)|nr:YbaN family protein [Prevotellaceae bacterium]
MRYILVFFGAVSLGLGILGIFLPLLPTTPFLLLSAFLFARGSEKLYNWLLNHKILGKYINGFLHEKTIPLRIKIYSISMLWLTIICSIYFLSAQNHIYKFCLLLVAIGVTIHILSYKTKNK